MALLSACWLLIIESILIQDGFLKWSYMKLYMHPLVLFLCQLLLWLYLFFSWLLPPFQAFYYTFLSLLVKLSKLFSRFLRMILVSEEISCNIESRQEIKNTNLKVSTSIHNHVPAFSFSFKEQVDSQLKVLQSMQEDEDCCFYECDQNDQFLDAMEDEDEEEEEEEEDIDIVDPINNLEFELHTMLIDQEEEDDDDEEDVVNSDVENDLSSQVDSDREHHSSSLSNASLDSSLQDSIMIENQTQEDDETDQVYKTYCERMKWYDILSHDRTYGLSVIKNQETASSLSLWGKTAEKKLKEVIKKDLELVYVAQSCLSWEALQHQYITVRDSLEPSDSRGRLYDCREFQNFQILLERFLEDERCQGNRVSSFVQRRLELMSFFQVPRLSGSYNREGPREGEDKQVLKSVEKCIKVFNDFVKIDLQKPLIWERLKISFVKSPLMELEDPRDFKLFLDLKTSLQKKEQLLKKTWFKKKSSKMGEAEIVKDENFMLLRFIVIDLKLVSRVLHMSLVSSSHLKWCQDKLNNIHFNGDKISRTYSLVFFPSS